MYLFLETIKLAIFLSSVCKAFAGSHNNVSLVQFIMYIILNQ